MTGRWRPAQRDQCVKKAPPPGCLLSLSAFFHDIVTITQINVCPCDVNAVCVLSGAKEASSSSQGQWVYVSDTTVQTVPESRVLNSQAYLLFYEEML